MEIRGRSQTGPYGPSSDLHPQPPPSNVPAVLVLLLVFICAASARAQQPTAADPAAVPIEQEPRHHLVFTNDFVRVLDVLLPPLYVSQRHTHTYDNVSVTILPGGDDARAQARIGFAGYSRGGYSHVITNPNTAPMRFIAVELRGADRGVAFGEPAQDDHLPVLSNARVRITRVKLSAGESLPEHQHANGYVSVIVRGGEGPGVWKWHPAGEAASPLSAGAQPLELVEVEGR